jgi:hypothetical protein
MPEDNTYLPPTPVIPGYLLIINITRANPCVVTIVDSDENTYIAGQCVHFSVPSSYGMTQISQQTGQIIAIDGLDFSVDLDTTQFDAFVYPPNGLSQPASIAPAGSRNLEFNNNANRVAFQSLNNAGN